MIMNDTLPKHQNIVEGSDDNIHRCYPDTNFKKEVVSIIILLPSY